MRAINRTAVYVGPKQPYIDWANSFDDGGPTLSLDKAHGVTFLIPDTYDETNFEKWLKKNYREIFIAAGQESRSFGRSGNQHVVTEGARVRSLPCT